MKKILLTIAVVFALSATTVAQTKKTVATNTSASQSLTVENQKLLFEKKAQQNVDDLMSFAPVSTEIAASLHGLFKTKHKMLAQVEGLSPERRTEINNVIIRKMESVIDIPTFEKIKANTALFQKLIN